MRDVLDEVTIQQEEDGKKVTIHRKDLRSQDVTASVLGDADLQDRVREMTGMDMNDLLSNARSVQGSGEQISQTTTTTQTFSGAEAQQKTAELGIDLDDALPVSTAQSPAVIVGVLNTLGWFFGS